MAWSGGVTSPEWSYKHRKSRLQLAVFLTSPSFRDWQVPSIHLLNAGHKLTGVTSQVFDTVRLWTAFSYILTPESEPTNTIPLSVPGLSPLPCSLAEGGALFNTDESPESVVHPVGGKARGRGPPPLSLDTLRHTCLMPFFFFFFPLNWGTFQTNLPPPITSCPLRFTPGMGKGGGRRRGRSGRRRSVFWADLKTTPCGRSSVSQRHKATLSNIYRKAVPDQRAW